MTAKSIPDNQKVARDMANQMSKKFHNLRNVRVGLGYAVVALEDGRCGVSNPPAEPGLEVVTARSGYPGSLTRPRCFGPPDGGYHQRFI